MSTPYTPGTVYQLRAASPTSAPGAELPAYGVALSARAGAVTLLRLADQPIEALPAEAYYRLPQALGLPATTVLLEERFVADVSRVALTPVAILPAPEFKALLDQLVLQDVSLYYQAVHQPQQNQPFEPGTSRLNYSGRIYDDTELRLLTETMLEFNLTAGRYDQRFCQGLKSYLGQRMKVSTTNSGSSANLLAVTALTSPLLGEVRLKPGDEVITAAVAFPTTVAPLVQNGLVPVFTDVKLGSYNLDADLLEQALSDKTRAIFIAHTLGIPFDLDAVLAFAERHGLWVIEDNCDALGAEYTLAREYALPHGKTVSGTCKTGTMGHIGTSSFYPAHQMTMGEGGAVYTDDATLFRILNSIRDWGRDCWCEPGTDNSCGKRFQWQLGSLPAGYDHKYIYSHFGYNLKLTDMQAAIGVGQLEKLPGFVAARRANWHRLREGLADLSDVFILPECPENAQPSPFGFVLTLRPQAGFTRSQIVQHLESRLIQTRTIFAGNILRQPLFADAESGIAFRQVGDLAQSDRVMSDTFWVGVYPGLSPEKIAYMVDTIRAFCQAHRQVALA